MFDEPLDPLALRVLGCLVEKHLSTPDYYPLTLNALVAACNQSSNRDPVLSLDDETVSQGLETLRERQLAWFITPAGSRVQKYEERLTERLHLSVQESAILAELLLRGPQTPGELRTRCTRMYEFPDLTEVEAGLQALAEAEPPLAQGLPRQPGTKEIRHAHLLGGAPAIQTSSALPVPPAPSRVAQLESELAQLRSDLIQLRSEFEAFVKQF